MVVETIERESPFWNRKLEIFGAIDIVPESRRWAESRKIATYGSLSEAIADSRPDVCIHTTSSSLAMVVSQLKELARAKIPVVSSSEELFHPWQSNAAIAGELDRISRESGVAVMGTGVNPGFVMDVLPAILTQAVQTVDYLKITRVVDAATRRLPLQRKIGAGLDEPTFRSLVEKGKIGHVGLLESLDFLTSYFGLKADQRDSSIEPVLAARSVKTKTQALKKGQVIGLHQRATASKRGRTLIELDLEISLGAAKPRDRIEIRGNPNLVVTIEGGTPGDPATVAALLRGIPIVLQAKPGIVRRLERDHFLNSAK